MARKTLVGLTAAVVLSGLVVGPAGAAASTPRPVTGGNGAIVLQGTSFPLSSVGYTQAEFFLSGTAAAYTPTAALGSDGRWQVAPASTAPYTTRVVVYRPANPARFNGTVVVEWLNVSGGLDVAPEWIYTHTELVREGFAWVGVSAQTVGVTATRAADPVRYAPLSHPGDSYSYDIFSQAGQAARNPAILGGLRPRTVLAEGESQSALRLTTYINAIHPVAHTYDGFLVHSRFGGSAPLSQTPQADAPTPPIVHFRPDVGAPVLTVQTETDLVALGYLQARQDDSPSFRLWEVAGTAHADAYVADIGATDDGSGAAGREQFAAMLNPPNGTQAGTCALPINTGQAHYVLDTAQHALNRWVTRGIAPPRAPRLRTTAAGTFELDANGNVLGGVRTPAVDAPVATLSGLGQSGTTFCFLFGTTTPFTAEKLATLYPTHTSFVTRWTAVTTSLLRAGFIRPADAAELIATSSCCSSAGRPPTGCWTGPCTATR